MISKTHIKAHKPRERQLNAKLCGSESAIFLILQITMFNNNISKTVQVLTVISSRNWSVSKRFKYSPSFHHETDPYHSAELYNSVFIAKNSSWSIKPKLFSPLPGCCMLCRTPFSNVVRMRICSLAPKPKTTIIGLGARLVRTWNCESSI